MTQLAETLFSHTPPIAWSSLFTLQNNAIKQVTYCHGQFNILEQTQQVSHYYLTLIGTHLTADAVLNLLQEISLQLLSQQTNPAIIIYPPTHYPTCLATTKSALTGELMVCGFNDLPDAVISQLDTILSSWSQKHRIDYALSTNLPSLATPGLVLMDMDSTTIQIECIDEIARLAGVGEQVAAVTARAMNGELDFSDSLRTRVATLADCPETVLAQVADAMPLMPGLELLIATLHQANWKVAIASGGFTYFAQRLQNDLGFDAVYANQLEIIDGMLTGSVLGDIVDAKFKADTLQALAIQYQISAEQTVAIGDGANDLLMLTSAALGVAIHAKPIVQQQAQVALNYHDLEGLVGLLHAANCITANWN